MEKLTDSLRDPSRGDDTFYNLVANAPFGVYVVDSQFRLREVSAGSRKVFSGVHPLLGRDLAEILRTIWPEPFASQAIALFRHTLETGETYHSPDTTEQRQDIMEVESYDWQIERVRLPDGTHGVVCYFFDMTERVRAQHMLAQQRQRLAADLEAMTRMQELSARLVRAGEMIPLLEEILEAAVDFTGTDMGDIQLHDAACGRLRIVVHRGLGPRFLEHFASRGWEACEAAARSQERVVLEDVTQVTEVEHAEGLAVLQAEGIRAVQSTPLASRDGRLLGMLTTHFRKPHQPGERELRLIDLLARQAADLIERAQAENAAREADTRKNEFLAMLAHELRNPLAPIRNAVHLLRTGGDARGSALGILDRQVTQMVRLVDDLLDLSRITRGRIELRRSRVDLASIVASAVEVARPAALGRGLELEVSAAPDPLPVDADPARLAQVAGNLLNNACKFTDPGGRVTVRLERDGGEGVLRVADTGIGIASDKLTGIFDMFTQLDTSLERSQGGLGIGLALVRSLVGMHGGSVEVRSDGPGRGSVFVVRLPLATQARDEPDPDSPPAAEPREVRRRVLVVDDNRDAATSLEMLLRLSGHEVHVALDGAEALSEAEKLDPDVVLLDIGMPKINGYEVARRIRARRPERPPVLVALTGWGQEHDRRRSEEAGFNAHVVKPVDLATLTSLLARLGVR